MPNWGDQFLDELDAQPITPTDGLLPKTDPKPQDGPLPPREKKKSGSINMFGKISVKNWETPGHVQRSLDGKADHLTGQ